MHLLRHYFLTKIVFANIISGTNCDCQLIVRLLFLSVIQSNNAYAYLQTYTAVCLLKFYSLPFIITCMLPLNALGREVSKCPTSIAIVAEDLLTVASKETLTQIYSTLWCNSKFVELPGRRGVFHFNTGLVWMMSLFA